MSEQDRHSKLKEKLNAASQASGAQVDQQEKEEQSSLGDTGATKKKRSLNLDRRQFSVLSGVSIAALVAVGALSRWGVTQEALSKGLVGIKSTPNKMIVTHRARCSGCQRCELACSLKNSRKASSEVARIKVWRNYQYGAFMGSGEGVLGDFNYTQDFCKQCKHALCMEFWPMSAIVPDSKTGARIVLDGRCIGCGTCHEACPWNMPTIDKETGKSTKCISCGRCARQCPNKAIEFIDWQDVADEYLKREGRATTNQLLR